MLPPIGVDFGLRCVWCPGTGVCAHYNKFERVFPCDDALRQNGGYPGGSDCNRPAKLVKGDARLPPKLPVRAWPNGAFQYDPVKVVPVSVVIPSFARPHNIRHQLRWLLSLEPLHRQGSEVIISHGSSQSYTESDNINSARVSMRCITCSEAPLRHLNQTSLNLRWFTAHRFFAASAAKNDVVLHLDDDLVPGEAMLQALIDTVALEPGFPHYEAASTPPGLHGPSGMGRSCSANGYQRGRTGGTSVAVLTNLASSSRALNMRYIKAFEDVAPLLEATRGNGEDLTFSWFARRGGGQRTANGTCDVPDRDACATSRGEFQWLTGAIDPGGGKGDGAFHARAGHYETRDRICTCLDSGLVEAELAHCVASGYQRQLFLEENRHNREQRDEL